MRQDFRAERDSDKAHRAALMDANFTETQSFQRDQLFELLDDLTGRIKLIQKWLEEKAADDAQVELLLTHKGVGLLSALAAVVHTLGDINRFPSSKEVFAYTGLDPLEFSSAGKVRFGSISKADSNVLRHLLGQAMPSPPAMTANSMRFIKDWRRGKRNRSLKLL